MLTISITTIRVTTIVTMGAIIAMTTSTEETTSTWLYRLMAWLSPSYPVGGFSYSHGLEWAVEEGLVTDRASLEAWLLDLLEHGGGRADAILFAHAYAAAALGDRATLSGLKELAEALAPTSELALETLMQGAAFRETTVAAWPDMAAFGQLLPADPPPAYPIAVGAAAAVAGLPLLPALEAYLHALLANLVSAGVRLIPLGQTDGQKAIATLAPHCATLAEHARTAPLDDLATATLMVDWCSMRHETQYTRLFRS
jgi:urease accessory protein